MKKQRILSWVLLIAMLISMFSSGVVATDSMEPVQEAVTTDATETVPEETPAETPEETPAETPAPSEEPALAGGLSGLIGGAEEMEDTVEGESSDTLMASSISQHSFGHLDMRVYNNSVYLKKYYINENNEKVYISAETLNAVITGVNYAVYDGVTYTGFYKFGSGEYRTDIRSGVRVKSSSVATFNVNLTAGGKTYNGVSSTFYYDRITQAAYDCNGYRNGRFDGLDFHLHEGEYFTFEVEVTEREVSVSKAWNDGNNQDGLRPDSVTVKLLSNGTAIQTVALNAANRWTYTFTGLPTKDSSGKGIAYTVEEVVPDGYTQVTSGDAAAGYTITNTHTPATTTISGRKTWADENDQDGLRPASITVNLLADGRVVHSQQADSSDGWSWSFEDLPVYNNGKKISYTIEEVAIPGYATTYDGYNITNTHVPEVVTVSGSKTWNDDGNRDAKRPASIKISLYKDVNQNGVIDGVLVKSMTVTEANGWKWNFGSLPKYENGKQVYYYIVEDAVAGYSTFVDGYNVTNTYTPETVIIAGSKTWNDGEDQDGVRPDSVTIILKADGEEVNRLAVTAADGWKGQFTTDAQGKALPRYKNVDGTAVEIVYTIEEVMTQAMKDAGYTSTVHGFNVVNTRTPETMDLSGKKTWDDGDDQDGIRPHNITITLMKVGADGKETAVETKWISAADNWSWSFKNLPKYDKGVEIRYYLVEETIDGYSTTIDGMNITNSHTPQTTTISGEKTWDDNDDQDGIRPASVTVKLLADGNVVRTQTVEPAANGRWTYSFKDLPVYANGQKIVYTVEEVAVAGYTPVIEGHDILNVHTPELISIPVTKAWDDADDKDGLRPDSITVKLLSDGKDTGKTLTIAGSGTVIFQDLPRYADGEEIKYTVEEVDVPEKYTASVTGDMAAGFTVTNTHVPETIDLTVNKVWNDEGNVEMRPDSIVLRLYGNEQDLYKYYTEQGETELAAKYHAVVTPDTEGNWSHTWTDLQKYFSGNEVTYSVWEVPIYKDDALIYDPSYKLETDGSITITNTYDPEHTSVAVTKIWDDNYDQDGIRPEVIKVGLYATKVNLDGSAIEGENETLVAEAYLAETAGTYTYEGQTVTVDISLWNHFWNELPAYVYDNHVSVAKYSYSVKELTETEGYTPSVTANDITGVWTITNTHKPETVGIAGSKTWVDNDDQDGIRPETITVELWKDTTPDDDDVDDFEFVTSIVTEDGWSFEDQPKYSHGQEIEYQVREVPVEGYETIYSGYSITNVHKTETVSIPVTKVWSDEQDQDGKRPDSIEVKLLADGEDAGKHLTLSETNDWSGSFEDLDAYKGGRKIEYTVEEVLDTETAAVYTAYTAGSAEAGYVITNVHEPETIDISGEKAWEDNNDQDGLRPARVTVELYADTTNGVEDGVKVHEQHASEDNSWSWSFEDIPVYENGQVIDYYIREVAVEGYEAEYASDGLSGITNTHVPYVMDIVGQKVWNDQDNQDGKRPASIVITLYRNDKTEPLAYAVVSAETEWAFAFEDLPIYDQGVMIDYYVEESIVAAAASGGIAAHELDDYSTEISSEYQWNSTTGTMEKVYTVVNTYTPETVIIAGSKTWNDGNDVDGLRPDSITIILKADGVEINRTEVTEEDNWKGEFTQDSAGKLLPRYKNGGVAIVYTIEELETQELTDAGYTSVVHGYNIVNTRTPETITITGKKSWDDANDQDGLRPHHIEVTLLADGEEVETRWVNEADGWMWTFSELPKYTFDENGKGGHEIVYTIEEAKVEGYESTITEISDDYVINIKNTHEPEVIDVSGSKTWDDGNNQDGIRPERIQINLMRNGEKVAQKIVTAQDNWSWTFEDMPRYLAGEEIVYTVTEEVVAGYSQTLDGMNVTNTHVPATTSIRVIKLWEDEENRDGIRPERITVKLMADGVDTGKALVLSEDNHWTDLIMDLPVYKAGEEIVYSLVESETEGYEAAYAVSADGTFITITNTHEIETTEFTVKKIWDDHDNADGIRPETVKIQLLADGEKVGEPVEVAESYTFKDLPRNEAGVEIVYTVEEVDVPQGYTAKYADIAENTVTITNVHEPETTEVKVVKHWVDTRDAKGHRPDQITIQLYANGEASGDPVTITAKTDWSYTFKDLPANSGGKAIVYTVKEAGVRYYIPKYSTGENGELVITNYHMDVPITGDTFNMILWSVLGGSAMLGLGGIGFVAKRRRFAK